MDASDVAHLKKEDFTIITRDHHANRPFALRLQYQKDGLIEVKIYVDRKINGKNYFMAVKEFYLEPKHIFIGYPSPSWGYSLNVKRPYGNTNLLRVGPHKYVFIGGNIYEFKSVKGDEIETFYSDIGKEDQTYPYAVGKKYVYFPPSEAVEKSFFDMKKDIWQQYLLFDVQDSLFSFGPSNKDKRVVEREKKTVKLEHKLLFTAK